MRNLGSTLAAIDAANGTDPNRIDDDQPLAQRQGQRASHWLARLTDGPSDELQLAVRAHHLKRWELARADYPEGRAGYLKWRRDNKSHQAEAAAAILSAHDWSDGAIERVGQLLQRERLRRDPDTQTLEDAACLVFLETQYDDMISRLDHEHMVNVVAKTLKKMSPAAIELAGTIELSAAGQLVLTEAAASLS